MSKVSKKICILGCEIGKSRLNPYLLDYQSNNLHYSTIGVKIYHKAVELTERELTFQFVIWDLASQSKYNRLLNSYLKGASGAVVVADINRQETIEKLVEYVQLFFSINPHGVAIAILTQPETGKELPIIYLVQFKQGEQLILNCQSYPNTYQFMDEIFKTLAIEIVEPDILPAVPEDTISSNLL
jgi:GTPase SAR1 family protein